MDSSFQTRFITPDGELYFGAAYFPAVPKSDKSSFDTRPMELSYDSPINQSSNSNLFNWKLFAMWGIPPITRKPKWLKFCKHLRRVL